LIAVEYRVRIIHVFQYSQRAKEREREREEADIDAGMPAKNRDASVWDHRPSQEEMEYLLAAVGPRESKSCERRRNKIREISGRDFGDSSGKGESKYRVDRARGFRSSGNRRRMLDRVLLIAKLPRESCWDICNRDSAACYPRFYEGESSANVENVEELTSVARRRSVSSASSVIACKRHPRWPTV